MNDPFGYQSEPSEDPVVIESRSGGNGYAIASLVLGITSVAVSCCCFCLFFLAPILSILSIIFCVKAKKLNGGKMHGKAIAGLILSIIGLVIFLFLAAVFLLEFIAIQSMSEAELAEFIAELEKIYADAGMDVDFDIYLQDPQS